MKNKTNEELQALVAKATAGDKKALETLIAGVQDIIFNMSLRMLGTFADAEDATQDILLKMITHLSSFRGDSSFTTWVFRIAANHLKNYKKHMFARYPLNFEYYGNDIENAKIDDVPDLTQNVETDILAEELKLSCTNVMLQCLDEESRCIFILGTMFQIDSRIAAELLELTPEAYRQRLCRVRKKNGRFSGAVLRRIWQRQMQMQGQSQLRDTESSAKPFAVRLCVSHRNPHTDHDGGKKRNGGY